MSKWITNGLSSLSDVETQKAYVYENRNGIKEGKRDVSAQGYDSVEQVCKEPSKELCRSYIGLGYVKDGELKIVNEELFMPDKSYIYVAGSSSVKGFYVGNNLTVPYWKCDDEFIRSNMYRLAVVSSEVDDTHLDRFKGCKFIVE